MTIRDIQVQKAEAAFNIGGTLCELRMAANNITAAGERAKVKQGIDQVNSVIQQLLDALIAEERYAT